MNFMKMGLWQMNDKKTAIAALSPLQSAWYLIGVNLEPGF
jgi:hypothetical protein